MDICVLCGSNSNLSTCVNPDLYGAFKLKSVPLVHVRETGCGGGMASLSTVIAHSDQIAIFQCQVFLFRPNQSQQSSYYPASVKHPLLVF